MTSSPYPSINDNQFAGLLQVATAAADAQERNASALGKRKRDDEAYIDHQLRTPVVESTLPQENSQHHQTLQSSAAVLFREPSEKSKKYSRPPLGKVYTDLELPPELFLQLQSAAKTFMLDPEHPERKTVVGQKKANGNNDSAKLKLWHCVERFLQQPHEKTAAPNGEYYFGHHAGEGIPDQPVRTFFWPEDRDQVIKMCMPLFRKMVTNERQRLYASETRKQDPGKQDKGATSTISAASTSSSGAVDPAHDLVMQDNGKTGGPQASENNMFLAESSAAPAHHSVMLHVNITTKDADGQTRRVTPRITMSADAAPNPRALMVEIQKFYDLSQHRNTKTSESSHPLVKVWLEQGLVPVTDDEQWIVALLTSETLDWMDGELRVVVEV